MATTSPSALLKGVTGDGIISMSEPSSRFRQAHFFHEEQPADDCCDRDCGGDDARKEVWVISEHRNRSQCIWKIDRRLREVTPIHITLQWLHSNRNHDSIPNHRTNDATQTPRDAREWESLSLIRLVRYLANDALHDCRVP